MNNIQYEMVLYFHWFLLIYIQFLQTSHCAAGWCKLLTIYKISTQNKKKKINALSCSHTFHVKISLFQCIINIYIFFYFKFC